MVDRLWEIAQGRFGARSMRACLESAHITLSQQRRIATAVILNSIPLATNPNGALLLTWLLDASGFPSRYRLLAPRFTPHLSHLCTHKLASLTVLRIVNQKIEPDASIQIVKSLFFSPNDHVLTDVLGDQVNGVTVVHKILTSQFIDMNEKQAYLEATKRVLIELKVIATQAYKRLIEEVGLPVSSFQQAYPTGIGQAGKMKGSSSQGSYYGANPSNDQNIASMMAALQMGGQSHMAPHPMGSQGQLQVDPGYNQSNGRRGPGGSPAFSPNTDPFNPFATGSPDPNNPSRGIRRNNGMPPPPTMPSPSMHPMPFGTQSPSLGQAGNILGMGQSPYPVQPQTVYPPYMYQMYQQQSPPNVGPYHS